MLQCSDHFLGQVKSPRSIVRDLGGILKVESRELVRECQFRIGSIVGPEGRRRSSLEFYVWPRDHAILHHFRWWSNQDCNHHCRRRQCDDRRVLLGKPPPRCRAEPMQRSQSLGKSATLHSYCSVLVVSLGHHGTSLLYVDLHLLPWRRVRAVGDDAIDLANGKLSVWERSEICSSAQEQQPNK
jgi:hypothetical protein